ncbi:MAG: polymer-forming cytoskeletal protein [Bdellovibrionales bacterium]|nr:polymer-forming cytoskeletal protein [Bdellovibrionales bacterium]
MSFGNFKKTRTGDDSQVDISLPEQRESKSSLFAAGVSTVGPGSSYSVVINYGTQISGQLSFEGPAFVDANVEGEIVAFDKLEIGSKGSIKAKIKGTEVIIGGIVDGDVIASKRLVLKSGSKVFGNIQAASLVLEEGAYFEGHCAMPKENQKSSDKEISSSAKVTSLAAGAARARSA